MAEHAADCAYPPVVTGDLNAEPGSDELRLLGGLLTAPAVPGLVLVDAWRYADPGDPGFTWDHRNGYQAGTVLPDSRIDYILVRPAPAGPAARSSRSGLGGTAPVDGVWPSDHFAVVADLRPGDPMTADLAGQVRAICLAPAGGRPSGPATARRPGSSGARRRS